MDNLGKVFNFLKRVFQVISQKSVALYQDLFWKEKDWLRYAQKRVTEQSYEQANWACDRALLCNTNSYGAWIQKGEVYAQLQDQANAYSAFKEALKINESDYTVWLKVAQLSEQLGKVKEAVVAYENIIDLQPQQIAGWIGKADLISADQPRVAANCYEKALQLDSSQSSIRQKLNNLLEEFQRQVDGYLEKAVEQLQLQSFMQVLSLCDSALYLRPDSIAALSLKGQATYCLGDYEESIKIYDSALELHEDCDILCHKGKALIALDRYQESIAVHEKALQLSPNSPQVTENHKKALQCFESFQDSLEESLNQGINLYEQGKYQEALRLYDETIRLIDKNLS